MLVCNWDEFAVQPRIYGIMTFELESGQASKSADVAANMAGCFASCTPCILLEVVVSKEHGLQTGLPKDHLKIMLIIYDRSTPVVQHLRLYTSSGQSDLSFWEALWQ